jgi:hypothetical protein
MVGRPLTEEFEVGSFSSTQGGSVVGNESWLYCENQVGHTLDTDAVCGSTRTKSVVLDTS